MNYAGSVCFGYCLINETEVLGKMHHPLPQDKFMLLSVINTKLRDQYPSLDALCDDLEADKSEILSALASIGYSYDPSLNRFC